MMYFCVMNYVLTQVPYTFLQRVYLGHRYQGHAYHTLIPKEWPTLHGFQAKYETQCLRYFVQYSTQYMHTYLDYLVKNLHISCMHSDLLYGPQFVVKIFSKKYSSTSITIVAIFLRSSLVLWFVLRVFFKITITYKPLPVKTSSSKLSIDINLPFDTLLFKSLK